MQLTQSRLDLISDMYEAAINPSHWCRLLDRLAPEIGAKGSALFSVDVMSESRCAVNETNSLYDEDVKSTYRQELSRFEESHLADVARSEPWSIVYDEERTRSPVTFSRRQDVAYLRESCGVYERFAVKLNDDPAWFDCLTFQYDHRRGNITAEEISRLQVYLPHIAQSVALSRWFRILRARFDAVLGALDRLRVGVFLVTPRMQIVVANKTGLEIVDRRECLSIRDRGQLKLRSAAQQARLAEAVKKACSTSVAEGNHEPTILDIPGASGADALCIEISPVRDADAEIGGFRGAVLHVVDPCAEHRAEVFGLKELYDLTAAEAGVAEHFMAGRTYAEIAQIRNVSPETVKTQVRSLLSKTKSRNRAGFLMRIFSINPPIDLE